MDHLDFTDLLPATVPGVPRAVVVKFNNSWLALDAGGSERRYLVAYRAMVFHPFADPPPCLPGQPGTPWAANWQVAIGDAEVEGHVPPGRTGRYFDGIGLARVRVRFVGDSVVGLDVVRDEILAGTDGLEDPRLFVWGGRICVHVHRVQPDPARGAPAPERPAARRTGAPWPTYVKIHPLSLAGGRSTLHRGYFFGTNVTADFEKNYGFFARGRRLRAVYGVAHAGGPFAVLHALADLPARPGAPLTAGDTILCAESRPNPPERDCFRRVYAYYARRTPGGQPVQFSSSGPLIRDGDGRWLGVGHAKIDHCGVYAYVEALAAAYDRFARATGPDRPASPGEALARSLVDPAFRSAAAEHAHTDPGVAAFAPTPGERAAFVAGLRDGFAGSPLAALVLWVHGHPRGRVSHWSISPTPNPRGDDRRILVHPRHLYLSFFYALGPDDLRLVALSDAYVFHDEREPRLLQFATNLAPAPGGGFLLGFGENDQRAKLLHFTRDEWTALLATHAPDAFEPSAFAFRLLARPETVLSAATSSSTRIRT